MQKGLSTEVITGALGMPVGNTSMFPGFSFVITDRFTPAMNKIEREANTIDIDYVEVTDESEHIALLK